MSDTNNHQTLINIIIFVEEHADSIIDEDQGSAWLRVFLFLRGTS